MPLTDRERRVIESPLSFSSKQRKTTKHRTKIKIKEILCDMQFLIKNYSKIYKEFGINMPENIIPSKNSSHIGERDEDMTDKTSDDPDLL